MNQGRAMARGWKVGHPRRGETTGHPFFKHFLHSTKEVGSKVGQPGGGCWSCGPNRWPGGLCESHGTAPWGYNSSFEGAAFQGGILNWGGRKELQLFLFLTCQRWRWGRMKSFLKLWSDFGLKTTPLASQGFIQKTRNTYKEWDPGRALSYVLFKEMHLPCSPVYRFLPSCRHMDNIPRVGRGSGSGGGGGSPSSSIRRTPRSMKTFDFPSILSSTALTASHRATVARTVSVETEASQRVCPPPSNPWTPPSKSLGWLHQNEYNGDKGVEGVWSSWRTG